MPPRKINFHEKVAHDFAEIVNRCLEGNCSADELRSYLSELEEDGVEQCKGISNDRNLFKPIHRAAQNGNVALINVMTEYFGDLIKNIVNVKDEDGKTPFLYILERARANNDQRCYEIASQFIRLGGNLIDYDYPTMFHYAAEHNICEIVPAIALVQENGKSIFEITNDDRMTPFHVAASVNNHAILAQMVELNNSPHAIDYVGGINNKTALRYAAMLQGSECISILIDANANVEGDQRLVREAFFEGGNAESVKLLLQVGAPVDYRNCLSVNNERLLHFAVRSGDIDLINEVLNLEDLLPGAINAEGKNAFDIARDLGNEEVIACLVAAGINPEERDPLDEEFIEEDGLGEESEEEELEEDFEFEEELEEDEMAPPAVAAHPALGGGGGAAFPNLGRTP